MMLKSGDIFFLMNHKNKVSKLISGAMGSEWSHSGIIYETGKLSTYTLETNDFCVTHGNFDQYLEDQYSFEVWRPKFKDEKLTEQALHDTEKQLLHKVYAYWQLLSFGLRRLFSLKIRNIFRGGHVCCGVVINFLNRTDIKTFKPIEPQEIDTEEMYKIVVYSDEFELVLKKNAI